MNSSTNLPRRTIFKLRIAPVAEKDLEGVYSYIAMDNPRAAANFFKQLRKKTETLKRLPRRCPKIPEKIEAPYEYRHLIVKRYRIVFCIIDDAVWIMRVIHGSRLLDLETLLQFPIE
jgi:plasmid stabilization system protein ParE